jgi:phosphohistidine phosphatase
MTEKETFLVLLRHGIAEEKGLKPDAARRLTKKGREAMEKIAASLVTFFPKAERIHTSPLRRCVETAAIVEKAFGGSLSVETTDALLPDATAGQLRQLVEDSGAQRLICVGHEPTLSAMMLELTRLSSEGDIELKKGGCYGLRVGGDGIGRLEWMLSPSLMRKIVAQKS